MVIKINYTSSDIYVSTNVSPIYVVVNYSAVNNGSGVAWGAITGTLSNQTDLQNALNAKFDDPTGTTAQYLRGDGSLATFPSLTGFVPYTGATTNVNLGEFALTAGQLTLDTSPTGTAAVATTRWNDTTGVSETTLKGGSVVLKNGVDLVARVVNKVTPNATLTKAAYQAVRVSGAQGQRLAVAYAQANNDANSADTIGLVCETIATNQEGFIMAVGQLEGINTTGSLQGETWVDGDVLYLSPFTAGAVTKVKPTGAGHIVVIGYVEYAHVNNGKIYVKVMNGWELDELHDVSIVSPANNEALIYESSTSLWKNKTIATALGYTPISGSGATGQVAYWNGTNSQTGSNNLFWDAANVRLGIGTNAPDFTIKSQKSVPAGYDGIVHKNTSSTGIAAIGVQGSAASNNDLSIFVCSPSQTIRSTFGLTGNYSELVANTANGFAMGTYTATPFIIGTNNTARLTIFGSTGNVVIQNGGTFTDGGQRLQVQGNVYVNGTYVGTNTVETTGTFYSRGSGSGFRFSDGASGIIDTGSSIQFRNYIVAPYQFTYQYGERTSGIRNIIEIPVNVNPTSGTAIYNMLVSNPTINQTGGANGITRGLYVAPTLTAAADWRSIEWSNNSGWGLYGAGTANNYLAGKLVIGTTTVSTFALDVNGTARVSGNTQFGTGFYWDNTNNRLGIGTATPDFALVVTASGGQQFKVNPGASSVDLISTSSFAPHFVTDFIFYYGVPGSGVNKMRLYGATGNLTIGGASDAGYKLDVSGTTRITGAAIDLTNSAAILKLGTSNTVSFELQGSALAVKNGTLTKFFIGSSSITGLEVPSTYSIAFVNPGVTTFSNINWNTTSNAFEFKNGDKSAFSPVNMSKLSLSAGTTAASQINLASSTAPTSPNNGDIWFDGTDIKMRIGGVTKTFTLV